MGYSNFGAGDYRLALPVPGTRSDRHFVCGASLLTGVRKPENTGIADKLCFRETG